jgi:hypothetical protein
VRSNYDIAESYKSGVIAAEFGEIEIGHLSESAKSKRLGAIQKNRPHV